MPALIATLLLLQGFVVRSWLRPWQSPAVKVVKRGVLLGPTEALLAQLPDVYGLYMLLAKPPGARRYLPVFLGKAGPAEGEGGGETIRERWGAVLARCKCTSASCQHHDNHSTACICALGTHAAMALAPSSGFTVLQVPYCSPGQRRWHLWPC